MALTIILSVLIGCLVIASDSKPAARRRITRRDDGHDEIAAELGAAAGSALGEAIAHETYDHDSHTDVDGSSLIARMRDEPRRSVRRGRSCV